MALAALQFYDSAQTQKKRKELEEKLKKGKEDLQKFLYDNGIELQKKALDNEYIHVPPVFYMTKAWSLKKIQEWLRHSDIETTGNIYVHILKSRQVIENDNMDEIFSL